MVRAASLLDEFCSAPDAHLGPFHLVRLLGKGGFAPVWLAREMLDDQEVRTVAVKLFGIGGRNREGSGDSKSILRDRVLDEARALCRVEHPNVVRFHTIANDPSSAIIGLVMEYVQGQPLDRVLDEKGVISVAETLAVAIPVASALAAVHGVGLVHRDVKPANIVEAAGVYKLIDFGIAAADPMRGEPPTGGRPPQSGTRSERSASAGSGSDASWGDGVTGTVGYVDPACFDGREAPSPASDLYSLGATLYECLTGKLPSVAGSRERGESGMAADVLAGRVAAPSLKTVEPSIPEALAALVDALLDPTPSARPHSAEAVAWELERVRCDLMGRSRPLPPEGPFRGLGRFEADDRDVYFGRGVEIAASLELLRTRGLVALIGPSGSGKSSLGRAGVLPVVAEGGLGGWPRDWDTVTCVPGTDARNQIGKALAAFVDDAAELEPEALVERLSRRVRSEGRGLVLLVDQLEELVTISSDADRQYAIRLLARIGRTPLPGLRAIVAARRDLLDPLLALEDLGRLLARGALLVSPMSASTWADVIDQALAAYGYSLEDDALRRDLISELEGVAPGRECLP